METQAQLLQRKTISKASKKKQGDFFSPAMIQRKLSIGSSNDTYEMEADRVADKVVGMGEGGSITPQNGALVQRKCAACTQKEEKIQKKTIADSITPMVQRKGGGGEGVASKALTQQINNHKGGGHKMDSSTQNFMESRFGTGFSDVRLHTGSQAIQMSKELNAKAFTVGNDIFFNEGMYNPNSTSGKHLLAHELTHTLQQGGIRKKSIQRSCHDGNCATCAGGTKTLWLTAYFRVRAHRANMTEVRREINEAKNVLKKCCVNLKVEFDWRLLSGGGSFDPGRARPAGDANGPWDYTNDSETLGEGNTFNRARGIPMLFVDDVPRTGGGVTVAGRYDRQYTGPAYIVVALNQAGAAAQSTIAHELGHVAGLDHSTALAGSHIMNSGEDVDAAFCRAIRALA